MPSKTTLHGRARVDSVTPDAASAAGLLRMANMFCDAKALIAAAELNLFGILHGSPCTAEEIRSRLGLHGRGLADLLNLLVGIGILDKADGRYANTAAVDRYLVPGPDYLGGFLIGAGVGLATWMMVRTLWRFRRPPYLEVGAVSADWLARPRS